MNRNCLPTSATAKAATAFRSEKQHEDGFPPAEKTKAATKRDIRSSGRVRTANVSQRAAPHTQGTRSTAPATRLATVRFEYRVEPKHPKQNQLNVPPRKSPQLVPRQLRKPGRMHKQIPGVG
jgi:hypothetical protein